MTFQPQINRLPGNTHIHSQLDVQMWLILYKNLMIKVNLTNGNNEDDFDHLWQ